jgi:hypothetical protein
MDIPQQTIESFFRNAVVNDFSRDYLFRIESLVLDGGLALGPSAMLYAKSGKLPARNIVNQTVKYAGQTFNIPGSVEFPGSEAYEIEFYCPRNGGSIANQDSRITLLQLNKNLDPIYQYDLVGCSIRTVGELTYGFAEGNGAVVSFTTGIAYHFFTRGLKSGTGVVPQNF